MRLWLDEQVQPWRCCRLVPNSHDDILSSVSVFRTFFRWPVPKMTDRLWNWSPPLRLSCLRFESFLSNNFVCDWFPIYFSSIAAFGLSRSYLIILCVIGFRYTSAVYISARKERTESAEDWNRWQNVIVRIRDEATTSPGLNTTSHDLILVAFTLYRAFQRSVHFVSAGCTSSWRESLVVSRHRVRRKDGVRLRMWGHVTNCRVHLRYASVCWSERLIFSGWSSDHLVFLRLWIGRTDGVRLPLWWRDRLVLLLTVRPWHDLPVVIQQLNNNTGLVHDLFYSPWSTAFNCARYSKF